MAHLNDEERTGLTCLVMSILDGWGLNSAQQIALLGLPEKTSPRTLTRFRQGSQSLPEEGEVMDRSKHILGIAESLQVVFPLTPTMPPFWLRNRNRQFGTAPLAIMLDEGVAGMHRIWCFLDSTQTWD